MEEVASQFPLPACGSSEQSQLVGSTDPSLSRTDSERARTEFLLFRDQILRIGLNAILVVESFKMQNIALDSLKPLIPLFRVDFVAEVSNEIIVV